MNNTLCKNCGNTVAYSIEYLGDQKYICTSCKSIIDCNGEILEEENSSEY